LTKFFFIQTVSVEMVLQLKNFSGKKFLPENFSTKIFLVQTVSEEMILQQKKLTKNFSDQNKFRPKLFDENFLPNCFRGNDFATNNFRPKKIVD
jgi:hypothetical protein